MKQNGFTLVELGIVLSAMSVLTVSTMTYNGFRQAAVHTQVRKALKDIRTGTAASLTRISIDDAVGHNNWLEYLGDNNFIATDETHSITFAENTNIIQAGISTSYGPAFLAVLMSGLTDTAAEDLLNTEAKTSSYYENAQFPLCNQKVGDQYTILCYKL
ncbi:MAG: hypothetical protein CMH60_03485 [Myxococcales bacterium]|nr:hypothetical protein [Myxococcales bacterium]|tara:strand:- start:164 stop:640 length:477 start_codon:yes stop_codon:yes gene_type:complete